MPSSHEVGEGGTGSCHCSRASSSRQMSGSPQSSVPGVEMSQRPLFLPTFYTSESPMMTPSCGARCLNGTGGLLDYSWSMLSELGQTGHLLTGFWGCCCFGEPCCCVSCPSCLPSFLPASRGGVPDGQGLSGLYHPAPCPHTQPRRQLLRKSREELLAMVSLCWPYSLKY